MSYKAKIYSFFSNQPNIVMVYLFGSQMWKSKPGDIDIAILFENDNVPDTYQLINLQEELSEKFGKDVDLICLNEVSVILKMQVIKKGEKIIDNNPSTSSSFISATLNEYFDLKRIREPIERQLLKGRIYG